MKLNLELDNEELRFLAETFPTIITQGRQIMAMLDDLTAKVEANNKVDESAITLLQGLKQKLDEAGTDAAKLKELSNSLGSSTDALAAAVAANTPAEPDQPVGGSRGSAPRR